MRNSIVLLITGHPATDKTTLAHALAKTPDLPLLWKDQIKESLQDTFGNGGDEWSRKLSGTTWKILYQQIKNLLDGSTSFIAKGNFDPRFCQINEFFSSTNS